MTGPRTYAQGTRRPGGITLLAIIFILLAILSFVWSLLIFGVGGFAWLTGWLVGAEGWKSFGGDNTWSGVLGIVTAIVQLFASFGLLALKKWAWLLALVAVALTVATGLAGMFSGGLGAFLCGGLGLVVPASILFYLMNPRVRSAFGM